jgi:hypothetical protein
MPPSLVIAAASRSIYDQAAPRARETPWSPSGLPTGTPGHRRGAPAERAAVQDGHLVREHYKPEVPRSPERRRSTASDRKAILAGLGWTESTAPTSTSGDRVTTGAAHPGLGRPSFW